MKVKTSILLLLMIATALPSFGGNGNGNGTDSLQATRYVTRATMYGVGLTKIQLSYIQFTLNPVIFLFNCNEYA